MIRASLFILGLLAMAWAMGYGILAIVPEHGSGNYQTAGAQ
jgi:hypothetical protein